jgi:hypothetical protein
MTTLTALTAHFGEVRTAYGAELSNVIERIAFRVERRAANEFEPMIFPVTKRRA